MKKSGLYHYIVRGNGRNGIIIYKVLWRCDREVSNLKGGWSAGCSMQVKVPLFALGYGALTPSLDNWFGRLHNYLIL